MLLNWVHHLLELLKWLKFTIYNIFSFFSRFSKVELELNLKIRVLTKPKANVKYARNIFKWGDAIAFFARANSNDNHLECFELLI